MYLPDPPATPQPDRCALDAVGSATFERLYERRIVFLRGTVDGERADELIARLLALDGDSGAPVMLYVDSPGGDPYRMFAVHDTLQLMAAPVDTRCVGLAASAAAFLLATGTGTRSASANARIVLCQPGSAASGAAADLETSAAQIGELRARMERILAERTGQSPERVARDLRRDFWLSAEEARAYGLIDEVVGRRQRAPAGPRGLRSP